MATEPLYKYQEDAVERIVQGLQTYLGFDPGLGKSRTALEAAIRKNWHRILIISPASGRYVWVKEVEKWTGRRAVIVRDPRDLVPGSGIFILTYGLISMKGSDYPGAVAKGAPFQMTILDEAAAVKNHGSNRTQAILGPMLAKLGYVLPLSGTPAPNHAGELYPILRALYPESIRGSNGHLLQRWQFEDHFCRVVSKRFGTGPSVRVIEGSRNLPELKRRIEPFMLRVRKEAVLKDLPPVRYDVVPLGVVRSALPPMPDIADDNDFMKYLNGRLGDEHLMKLRHALGLSKTPPAIEYLDEFLQNLPTTKKILVFAHHREVISQLMTGLSDWSPVAITGSSSPATRAEVVELFLKDRRTRVFVGNIQAAGTMLTLVGPTCDCSDVFFVEASYSAGDNVQAAARVHRIGQREAVVARFLTAHGTIDDRIQAILARKANDFATLFN